MWLPKELAVQQLSDSVDRLTWWVLLYQALQGSATVRFSDEIQRRVPTTAPMVPVASRPWQARALCMHQGYLKNAQVMHLTSQVLNAQTADLILWEPSALQKGPLLICPTWAHPIHITAVHQDLQGLLQGQDLTMYWQHAAEQVVPADTGSGPDALPQ